MSITLITQIKSFTRNIYTANPCADIKRHSSQSIKVPFPLILLFLPLPIYQLPILWWPTISFLFAFPCLPLLSSDLHSANAFTISHCATHSSMPVRWRAELLTGDEDTSPAQILSRTQFGLLMQTSHTSDFLSWKTTGLLAYNNRNCNACTMLYFTKFVKVKNGKRNHERTTQSHHSVKHSSYLQYFLHFYINFISISYHKC